MPNEIWVFAEQRDGKVRRVAFELLTAGTEFSKKQGKRLRPSCWEAGFKML